MERGDWVDAEQHLRVSLAFHRNGRVLTASARLLVAKGDLKAAEPRLSESLALRRAQRGKSHSVIAASLASLRLAQKRCGDAISLGREVLAMSRQFLPEHHLSHATAGLGLARAPQSCGEAAEAAPLAQAALKVRIELTPPRAWQFAEAKRLALSKPDVPSPGTGSDWCSNELRHEPPIASNPPVTF